MSLSQEKASRSRQVQTVRPGHLLGLHPAAHAQAPARPGVPLCDLREELHHAVAVRRPRVPAHQPAAARVRHLPEALQAEVRPAHPHGRPRRRPQVRVRPVRQGVPDALPSGRPSRDAQHGAHDQLRPVSAAVQDVGDAAQPRAPGAHGRPPVQVCAVQPRLLSAAQAGPAHARPREARPDAGRRRAGGWRGQFELNKMNQIYEYFVNI